MIGLPLGFTSPLLLLALAALPILWWLLRLVPPRPRRIPFPPTRILFDIEPKEETPARTPWWLTDGVELGAGAAFGEKLGELARDRLTIVNGGVQGGRALAAADNAAGGLTVKVLRADDSAPAQGAVRARDLRGFALGDATFAF